MQRKISELVRSSLPSNLSSSSMQWTGVRAAASYSSWIAGVLVSRVNKDVVSGSCDLKWLRICTKVAKSLSAAMRIMREQGISCGFNPYPGVVSSSGEEGNEEIYGPSRITPTLIPIKCVVVILTGRLIRYIRPQWLSAQ